MNKKLILEKGTKFGKWTVLSDETRRINNVTNWWCQCECTKMKYVPLNNLMNESSTQCKECSDRENGLKKRTGYELISGNMWSQLKSNAKKKNLPFDLRIEEAWNEYLSQQGKCMYTNSDIKLYGYEKGKKPTAKISLIKPELGYVKGNICWVHSNIAKMKGDLSSSDFFEIIRLQNETENHLRDNR